MITFITWLPQVFLVILSLCSIGYTIYIYRWWITLPHPRKYLLGKTLITICYLFWNGQVLSFCFASFFQQSWQPQPFLASCVTAIAHVIMTLLSIFLIAPFHTQAEELIKKRRYQQKLESGNTIEEINPKLSYK